MSRAKRRLRYFLPVILLATARPSLADDARPHLPGVERVKVTWFKFTGNTAFSQAELEKVVASFRNRELSEEDLEEARRAVTQFYVEHGYVNSGAVLPEQDIEKGTVTFNIVEGALTSINITGQRHLDRRYLRGQIERGSGAPLNVIRLRDALELLRQNQNIGKLNANVQPGTKPGEALLQVAVEDQDPSHLSLTLDNHRPPSVGAERLRLVYENTNVSGWDDSLDLSTGLTHDGLRRSDIGGLHDFAAGYKSPEFFGGTRLQFNYTRGDTAVIEEPFRDLDISSKSENISVGLRRPLKRTLNFDTALTLSLEHRKSESFLFGIPFSFSEGDDNGVSETTALRFGQEYLRRGAKQVFAARGLLSWGNNFPGSTENSRPPGGKFVTFLGQMQHVRVLDERGRQLILRLDGQWSKNALLSVEKFSIGGAGSVRGYRENQLVRDMGIVGSAELRIPVMYDKIGRDVLTLAPFFDIGYGKDRKNNAANDVNRLSSVGIGLVYNSRKRLEGQVYWGYGLDRVPSSGNDLQDSGVSFALGYKL